MDHYCIRTSSRRVFRRCLRKWGFQSSLRDNLEHIGTETNINFWFGSGIHFAMEDYFGYNKFGDPRRAFKAYVEAFPEEDRPVLWQEYLNLGLGMLTYFLHWYPRHNSDMGFKTIWFDDNCHEAIPGSLGSHPGVEEDFMFDLGIWAIVDKSTGKIIKEWQPEIVVGQQGTQLVYDKLYHNALFGDLVPIKTIKDVQESDKEECLYAVGDKMIRVQLVPIYYHGTMDRIIKDRWGNWYILDYKTAKGADTRKLETDDQITSYMWAAQQKYQHPFKGFVYLQLTKELAKPPVRLKNGQLSTNKKQKTTYDLYKKEVLKDYGEVGKAPKAIQDVLAILADVEQPEGDRFIRWDIVDRNSSQIIAEYRAIMAETHMMLDTSMYLFPNPTRDCGWDCPFRDICISMDKGLDKEELRDLISETFQVREEKSELNHDPWRVNIKYPEKKMGQSIESSEGVESAIVTSGVDIDNPELLPDYNAGEIRINSDGTFNLS